MKLYKKTLLICTCIFLVCFLLSILFKFTYLSEIEIFKFIKNYMIGITCSILVVIITTYVQFKFEQKKIVDSIVNDIHRFYFHYLLVVISLDPEEKVSDKLWEHHYNTIQKDIENIMCGLNAIEWFSKNKKQIVTKLYKGFLHLRLIMSKELDTQREFSVKEIVADPVLKNIKDNTLLLATDVGWLTKEISEDYKKAEICLDELRKAGYWEK